MRIVENPAVRTLENGASPSYARLGHTQNVWRERRAAAHRIMQARPGPRDNRAVWDFRTGTEKQCLKTSGSDKPKGRNEKKSVGRAAGRCTARGDCFSDHKWDRKQKRRNSESRVANSRIRWVGSREDLVRRISLRPGCMMRSMSTTWHHAASEAGDSAVRCVALRRNATGQCSSVGVLRGGKRRGGSGRN